MDIRKVKKLIELLDESGIAEIEIKEGEESVRISRYAAGAPPAPAILAAPAAVAAPAPAAAPASVAAPAAAAEAEEEGTVAEIPQATSIAATFASTPPILRPALAVPPDVPRVPRHHIAGSLQLGSQLR